MTFPARKIFIGSLIALLCITVGGCAGSKSTIVDVNLTSQKRDPLNVMPFNTTFERKYYSDASLRYKISLLGGFIATEINKRSGLYTYTFDEKDLTNLRVSLIDSLKATNHFNSVNDIEIFDENMSEPGLRLYIDFESMGVSQKLNFICEINAHAKVTDSNEKVLVEKDIPVSEKGTMTLSAAKNKAIEEFILQISNLLNDI